MLEVRKAPKISVTKITTPHKTEPKKTQNLTQLYRRFLVLLRVIYCLLTK
jgi:hypothetical protein